MRITGCRTPLLRTAGVVLIGLAIALALTGVALAAFSDMNADHPYATAINDLAARHIVSGFDDGTFRPDNDVIRQQFAKMIVLTLGYDVPATASCPFADVDLTPNPNDANYPARYVAVCALHGVTTGKTATTFDPYSSITRQQLISMVTRAAGLADPGVSFVPTFVEGQFSITEHFLNARKAAAAGLLAGLQGVGPSYDFVSPASRGECAQLLYNLSNLLKPKGPLPGFADLKPTAPVGYHITVATSSFWRQEWETDGWYESNQSNPYKATTTTGHLSLQIVSATGGTVTWRLVVDELTLPESSGGIKDAVSAALPGVLEVTVDEHGQVLGISSGAKGAPVVPMDSDVVARLSDSLAPFMSALLVPYSGKLVEPGDSVHITGPYPSATKKWMDVDARVTLASVTGDAAQLGYTFSTTDMNMPLSMDLLPLLVTLGVTPGAGHTEAVLDMSIKGTSSITSSGQITLDTTSGLPTAVTSTSTANLDMYLNRLLAPELMVLFPDSELMNRLFVHDMTITMTLTKDAGQ
ncbi:MAG: S-layer homology domain-containing protein [bacterium]